MVDDPGEYSWSSYAYSAFGIITELQTPHSECLSLGMTKEERVEKCRALFKAHVSAELWKKIRGSVNKGWL